ncbi:hypothetical protein BES34_000540 [Leptospira inadai serovar Lyme]|uniref:Uncharacterized protein n=1 Tax=Leptospira inadai serovar Lyme TaxID=293084 RepID=A0ABX4YNF3_9LEPT|nr:hypothetical protein BES34_000540 [Leptospira inadai serovar Lyme]
MLSVTSHFVELKIVAALRDRFATLAWASPNSALSLALLSKPRAKSFGLAELRQLSFVIRKLSPKFCLIPGRPSLADFKGLISIFFLPSK